MIVETYKIGETIIHIDDDSYINKSPDEIAQTLENIRQILLEIYGLK